MKSNFGGGNTDWEESRLGSYADRSETMLKFDYTISEILMLKQF